MKQEQASMGSSDKLGKEKRCRQNKVSTHTEGQTQKESCIQTEMKKSGQLGTRREENIPPKYKLSSV
jgi:hypothetical protein